MPTKIKQAPLWGRIGTGLGQGLASQIPKEIENYRHASGLRDLAESSQGLSPTQFLAKVGSVYGMTPQEIESFTELAKTQNTRNAYTNPQNRGQQPNQTIAPKSSPDFRDIDFANLAKANNKNQQNQTENVQRQIQQSQNAPQGNFPEGQPQIVEQNPLNNKFLPAIPWTPEQKQEEIGRVWDQHPYLTFPEVSQIASDNERRYIESPEAYQKQQAYLEQQEDKVNQEVESQLRKKLHIPANEPIFSKLPGESQNRVERGVSNELRRNPNANVKDLVNKWTDRALFNEKQKSELQKISNRSFDEKISPSKREANLDKLKSISKSFHEFGNSEEYYNSLKKDFGLSPEGAASIAYPLSKQSENYIRTIKPSNAENAYSNPVKYANDLVDYLTREDSLLSIAKNIKSKDPFFDIRAFLSEVRSIEDQLGLTDQQKLELNTRGTDDIFPNWGDIFLFPKGGRGL